MPAVFTKFAEIVAKHHGEMPPNAKAGSAHGNDLQQCLNDAIKTEVQEEYAEILVNGLIHYMRTDGGDFLRFAVTALLLTVGEVDPQGVVGRVCDLMCDLLPDEYELKKGKGKCMRPHGLEAALCRALPNDLAEQVFAKVTGNPEGSEFGISDFATVKYLIGPKMHNGLDVTAKAEFAAILAESLFAEYTLVYTDGVAEPPVLPTVEEVLTEMARKDNEITARFMEACGAPSAKRHAL
jgi:hypothetical protein